MKTILKCQNCGKYTMNEKCSCGGNAVTVRPMRISFPDKYANYRRDAKAQERREKGLI